MNAARIVLRSISRRCSCAHADLVRAAERAAAVLRLSEQWADEPVLGARCELHDEVDRARDAGDGAEQLARRVEAEVVTALSLGERERVEQPDRAALGRERRLQDERIRQVTALAGELAGGTDRPVAGVGVEEAGEDGRPVEPRQAEPVDRAVAADQRRGVAVGQQAVRGDRSRAAGGRSREWWAELRRSRSRFPHYDTLATDAGSERP